MKMQKEEITVLSRFIRPILIGSAIGGAVCFLVLLLLAAVIAAQNVPQAAVLPLAVVAAAVGAFCGGFAAAKFARRNGWLLGGSTAFLLFLLTVISGFDLFGQLNGSFLLVKLAVMLACGTVGGIVAVNTGKKRR